MPEYDLQPAAHCYIDLIHESGIPPTLAWPGIMLATMRILDYTATDQKSSTSWEQPDRLADM